MGVFFDEPGYPVIDKAPRFWKTGDLCGTWATAVVAVKRTYSDLLDDLQLGTSAGKTGQHLLEQEPCAILLDGQ